MSQENSASDWGFDSDTTAESKGQQDSSVRDHQALNLNSRDVDGTRSNQSAGSWGFGCTVGPSQSLEQEILADHIASWSSAQSQESSSWITTDEESVNEIFESLPGPTRESLNSLGIQTMLNLKHELFAPSLHNMLHIVANHTFYSTSHRRRPWQERLEIMRQVVKVLVAAGVDVNEKGLRGETPLIMAVAPVMKYAGWRWMYQWICDYYISNAGDDNNSIQSRSSDSGDTPCFADEATIIALLEGGAKPLGQHYDANVLSIWLNVGYRANARLERFDEVLGAILNNIPSINAKLDNIFSDTEHKTFLHELVQYEYSDPSHVGRVLMKLLDADLKPPLNVDSLDSDGKTPLLTLLDRLDPWQPTEDSIFETARILIAAGARFDFVSASGDTVLSTIIDQDLLESRSPGDDKTLACTIERVFALDPYAKTGHSTLVNFIPVSFLGEAIYRGYSAIAAILLRYGMKRHIDRVIESPEWLAEDLFDGYNQQVVTAVCEQLGKPSSMSARVSGRHKREVVGARICDLAFCGLGRTRFLAWSWSFVRAYPMFSLAGGNHSIIGKDYLEDLDRVGQGGSTKSGKDITGNSSSKYRKGIDDCESKSSGTDTSASRSSKDSQSSGRQGDALPGLSEPIRALGPLLMDTVKERKVPPTSLVLDRARHLKFDRLRPSRRAHSCPRTGDHKMRTLESLKPARVDYYAYSGLELRTKIWRRDSLPDLSTRLTAGLHFEELQPYVFRSDGVAIRGGRVLLREDIDEESLDWLRGGRLKNPTLPYQPLVPYSLVEQLDYLNKPGTWDPKDFDLEAVITTARQAIRSTTEGHPRRERWIESLRLTFKFRDRNLLNMLEAWPHGDPGENLDLEESLNAHREYAWSMPADSPYRASSLNGLVGHLERLYHRTGDTAFLDEAVSTAKQVLEDSFADDWDILGLSDAIDRPLYNANLALLLTTRHRQANVPDLGQAIDLARQALQEAGPNDRPWGKNVLRNVGINLARQYKHTSNICDLDEAIDVALYTLYAGPDENTNEADLLLDLLPRLWDRYRATGSMTDLERARECARQFRLITRDASGDSTTGDSSSDSTGYLTDDSTEIEEHNTSGPVSRRRSI
ncbi:hypothetical protein BDV41DRAFT_578116 [Aspergillus transmontanensis]|uniref:Uncharacterized protein n=1 Tax=Aspergillus transmontanensis TaxID=1034304 RepID=A0A5N6VY99_9EURO|nr:hypothetical protein BDV41DRAFT_578116 [Aspergillus transmontanensis]